VFSAYPTVVFQPRQSRHPERSASQIYRKQRALSRGVEGPRRCLLADALGSFPAANYSGSKKVTNSERTRISYIIALTSDYLCGSP
jgi:hypothetical protein